MSFCHATHANTDGILQHLNMTESAFLNAELKTEKNQNNTVVQSAQHISPYLTKVDHVLE